MGDFQASIVLPRNRAEAFNFLCVPQNLLKMFPASATKNLDARLPDVLAPGASMEFNFKALGTQYQIIQQITDVQTDVRIVATQTKGPFKVWVHEQRLEDAPEGGTLLTNSIQFEPPGGLLGFVVTKKLILSLLDEWIPQGHELLLKSLTNDVK